MTFDRRTLLRGGAAAGLLAAGGLAVSGGGEAASAAVPSAARRTFLFVHGGWGNASNFHPLLEELHIRGHRALAIDFPGHGTKAKFPASYLAQDLAALATEPSPVAGNTLDDYINYTLSIATELAGIHGPIILAGHSLGGLTIGKVAAAAPQTIRRVVYIAAFMPVALPSAYAYTQTPEALTSPAPLDPLFVANPLDVGALRVNWGSLDLTYRAGAKAATFADVPDEVYTAYSRSWNSDEPLAVLGADARPAISTWGCVPRTYIRFSQDNAIPPALSNRMIQEANTATPSNPTDVRTVTGSHLGPLYSSAPRLAQILSTL
ncbi:alpha/beta fold hydrolase [Dactylosporangium sucinum]|uniref:Esterase n=1 Tax=Dactylosporangium sucinum TaxID=1424081 RepID=A0A917TJZ2_9ACTN|nr:alpha/beta hydrolase [Dactylosporangium sucinum]GGM23568.1 esterase [Dactylosporangium sucinum]